MIRTTLLLCALVATVGCSRRPPGAFVEDASPTETRSGRNSVRFELAEALLEADRVPEAQKVLQLAAQEGADPGELALLQGIAMEKSGLESEARTLYLDALKQLPHDARPLRRLALLDANAGDIPSAVDKLERAVRIDPNDAPSWNNLGFLRLSQQDYTGAREALAKAVALDASEPRYSVNLGFALAGLGHDGDALNAFRSVLSESEAQCNLATAMELDGRSEDARIHYQKALDADPRNEIASTGIERIQQPPEGQP